MFSKNLLFIFLIFLLFSPGKVVQGAVFVKREKCALCHIYDSIFFDKSIDEGDRTVTEREKDFCLSCHNGSVVDSREKLLLGYQHPEVVIEKKGDKKGERFVKRGCSACHNPHTKIGWLGYAGTDTSLYTGGDQICISCHQKFNYSEKKRNHRYKEKAGCLTCHTLHGASTKSLLKNTYSGTCKKCHTSIFKLGEEKKGHAVGIFKRKPVMFTGRTSLENREEVNLDCNVCHDIHEASVGRSLLNRPLEDLCNNCHKGTMGAAEGQKNNGNHPAAASCTDCHLVHFSDFNRSGKGIGGVTIDPAKLCSNCHSDKVGSEEGRWNHITGTGGSIDHICFRCHSMHKGILGSPNLISEGDVTCVDCHREENPLNEQTARPMAHPLFEVVSDKAILQRLSSLGGKTGKFGEIICRSCHAVHGAKKKKLLLADYKDMCSSCHVENEIEHGRRKYSCTECHYVHGIKAEETSTSGEDLIKRVCNKCHGLKTGHKVDISEDKITNRGDLPLFDRRGKRVMRGRMSCPTCHDPHGKSEYEVFLRKPYYGATFLCVSCHPEKENVSLTPHDLRSLVSESLCEPCHSPHHGGDELMWGFPPGGKDSQEQYCGSCHSKGEMASALNFGQGHPVNVIPRNKEGIPFAYYDSKWAENELGMISCPSCHDVHGEGITLFHENRKGLLHLKYGFGEDAGYIERENFCSACHTDKKNMITGYHGNIECESCHRPHEEPTHPEGAKEYSWFCVTCHDDVPAKDSPVFTIIGKEMERGSFSGKSFELFDVLGRKSRQGKVSCPSCHDVHSKNKRLSLSFKEDTEDKTCYNCHPEKKGFEDSPHDFSGGDGEGCRECHGLCSENIPREDVASIVDKYNAISADGKCLYCHLDLGGKDFFLFHPKNIKKVSSSYGAEVRLESQIKMVAKVPGEASPEFPLFNDKGEMGFSGSLGCMTCHDPHRGNTINSMGKKFLRDDTAYYISSICVPCHQSGAADHVREFHLMKRGEE